MNRDAHYSRFDVLLLQSIQYKSEHKTRIGKRTGR